VYIDCSFNFSRSGIWQKEYLFIIWKWILDISHKDLKYLQSLLTELALPWRSALTYSYMINMEDGLMNIETTITLMLIRVILPLKVKMTNLHSLRTHKAPKSMMNSKNSLDLLLEYEMNNMMISLNNKLLF
jgi:hypothetical protein